MRNLAKEEQRIMLDNLLALPLYHGTNSTAIPSIKEQGLDTDTRVWNVGEIYRINEILKKGGFSYGVHCGYDDSILSAVHVTNRINLARGYAMDSPELWYMLKKNIKCLNRNGELSPQEVEEARRLYKNQENIFKNSKPVVVIIDPKAPPILRRYEARIKAEGSMPASTNTYIDFLINRYLVSIDERIDPAYLSFEDVPRYFEMRMQSDDSELRQKAKELMREAFNKYQSMYMRATDSLPRK